MVWPEFSSWELQLWLCRWMSSFSEGCFDGDMHILLYSLLYIYKWKMNIWVWMQRSEPCILDYVDVWAHFRLINVDFCLNKSFQTLFFWLRLYQTMSPIQRTGSPLKHPQISNDAKSSLFIRQWNKFTLLGEMLIYLLANSEGDPCVSVLNVNPQQLASSV